MSRRGTAPRTPRRSGSSCATRSPESGGTLIFVKGAGAQTKIRLVAEPGGTKVTVSVGVGEAVGETL